MSQENKQQTEESRPSTTSQEAHSHPDSTRPYEHWKRRAYVLWALIGAGVVFVALMNVAGMLWQALACAIVAVLVAFLLHGPVDYMERKGIPRAAGASICMLLLIGILAAIAWALVPITVSETQNLIAAIPGYAEQARVFVESAAANGLWGMDPSQIQTAIDSASKWVEEQGSSLVSGAATGIIGGVLDFGTGAMICFIGLVCAFWFLNDLPKIREELRRLVPESHHRDMNILSSAFGTAVYGWLKATIICAVATGIITFIAFSIMGMPYAALLAVACAALYIIPYIGPLVAAVLSGAVGLLVSAGTALLAIVIVTLVINLIANLVSPKLMKDSVSVHPAIIMLVIMAGSGLGGMWGMLLSIPLAAAMQGVFVTYFEARTGKKLASPDGALFYDSSSASDKKAASAEGKARAFAQKLRQRSDKEEAGTDSGSKE